MKHKLIVGASVFVFFLGGCKGPVQQQKKVRCWAEQEARLYDIPVLINARPSASGQYDETKHSGFSYFVNVALQDAVTFYEREMERLGWQLFSKFDTDEVLLVFEKPTKISAVSLRPQKNQVSVVIFSHSKSLQ